MKEVGFTRRTELKAFAVKLEEALREFPENTTTGRWAYSVAWDRKLSEEEARAPQFPPPRIRNRYSMGGRLLIRGTGPQAIHKPTPIGSHIEDATR